MGSKLGWILAGVLVVGIVGAVIILGFGSSHSPPRETLKEGILDLKTIDAKLLIDVVGSQPSGSGNAGDDYAAAGDLAEKEKAVFDKAAPAVDHPGDKPPEIGQGDLDTLRKIASHVSTGAGKKELKYVFVHTPKSLDVHVRIPNVDKLRTAATAMRILGDYYLLTKKNTLAEKVYRDLLVFAWHLQTERQHTYVLQASLDLHGRALLGLKRAYSAPGNRNEGKLKALKAYEMAVDDLSTFYWDKRNICWSIHPWAGDVFNIIENDKDKAWRVQAVLALGIVKFRPRSVTDGDVDYAKALLGKLVGAQDPVIAAAAKAAKDLTIEDYRGLGTRF